MTKGNPRLPRPNRPAQWQAWWTNPGRLSPDSGAGHKTKKAGRFLEEGAGLLRSCHLSADGPRMKPHVQDELPEPMLEHRTRLRAYELYVQGGRMEGHALEDWLKAESEVLGKMQPDGLTPRSKVR
jgi:DUF2934 family protein